MTLRADWRAQLRRAHAELGLRYVRFHGLLDDDMATLLDEQGTLRYGFYNADLIFDFLLDIGMRPFVELSFMPNALASGSKTVFSYRGNVTPPKKLTDWDQLIGALVRHWVARYGVDEIRQWFFEVWNEPNFPPFWTGSQNDYFELYRHSVITIKSIAALLRVGGPATANDGWIKEFVDFCRREQLPYDFISTHHYPTDAFGKQENDTEKQLAMAQRSILRQRAQDTCAIAGDKPVYYTEWSTSSNPFFRKHDEPYAAAFMIKSFLDVADLVAGYSFWTFSDIFAENYFSSIPFHGGFGLLTIHGIAKPTYRAFQLLSRLGHERLLVDGMHSTVDIAVVRGVNNLMILMTNHAFPEHQIKNECVDLKLRSARRPTAVWLERIDEEHCHPLKLWESLGAPEHLNGELLRLLDDASRLRHEPLKWNMDKDVISLQINLGPHAVAAITLDFTH